MESKVKAIKIGSFIAFFSLISFCCIEFWVIDENFKSILSAIFSGIFTSSFVTLFIYVTEYFVEKKQTMEEYWNAAYKVNQEIIHIPYLVFDEPDELVMGYFAEISHNKLSQNNIMHTAEDKMVEYMRPYYEDLHINQEELDNLIRQSLTKKMREYEETINKVMEQYIKIAEISYEDVENAYGKIYFFSNQKYRKSVYRNIHKPLKHILQQIRIRAYNNFKLHLEKTGYNLPVMIHFINELQEEIFDIEYTVVDEEKGYRVVKNIKNQYYFKIDKQLEDFRAKIYHCKPEYQEEFCSFSRLV